MTNDKDYDQRVTDWQFAYACRTLAEQIADNFADAFIIEDYRYVPRRGKQRYPAPYRQYIPGWSTSNRFP